MDTWFSDKYVKLLPGTTPGQKHLEIKSICLRTWTENGQDTTHTSTIENIIYTITLFHFNVLSRGGVEDTRLEAKDTKKSEAKAKDSLSEDRHSRGQGQECSRPRTKDTSASALQKKKSLHKNFSGDLKKKKRSSQKFFKQSPQKTFSKKFFKRSTEF